MNKEFLHKSVSASLLLAILLIFPLTGQARTAKREIKKDALIGTIDRYRSEKGFEIVRLGSISTSFVKWIARKAARYDGDPEMQKAVETISGIKRVAIVEYENCNPAARDRFTSEVSAILKDSELLMEAKDGEDAMRMYGVVNENASEIRDFVIFVPEDATLICLFGSIPVESLTQLVE